MASNVDLRLILELEITTFTQRQRFKSMKILYSSPKVQFILNIHFSYRAKRAVLNVCMNVARPKIILKIKTKLACMSRHQSKSIERCYTCLNVIIIFLTEQQATNCSESAVRKDSSSPAHLSQRGGAGALLHPFVSASFSHLGKVALQHHLATTTNHMQTTKNKTLYSKRLFTRYVIYIVISQSVGDKFDFGKN